MLGRCDAVATKRSIPSLYYKAFVAKLSLQGKGIWSYSNLTVLLVLDRAGSCRGRLNSPARSARAAYSFSNCFPKFEPSNTRCSV